MAKYGISIGKLAFLSVILDSITATAQVSPAALLRGVEQSRQAYERMEVSLEILFQPPPTVPVKCLIEFEADKCRFEVFSNSQIPGQVIIRDGDQFSSYTRTKYSDLDLYDLERARDTRGDLVFDPRALGLSDLMPCGITVPECLWFEDRAKLELIGEELVSGLAVWRVLATKPNGATSEYWIEEPGFRVHRRIVKTEDTEITIDSHFDKPTEGLPFPTRVSALRKTRDESLVRVYTVESFKSDVDIPADRFTVKSIGLPVNTMANDYRINRIVGYWNGEGWSDGPVSSNVPQELNAQSHGQQRLLFILLNVVVIALLMYVIWKRRSAT